VASDPLEAANDVTQVLNAIQSGSGVGAETLLPLVYEELRRLARSRMAKESAGHTLQPTALVHEAWMRLVTDSQRTWENRAHFFGAAAEAMRRILVDQARRKQRQKRGGGAIHEPLEDFHLSIAVPAEELLAVHEALEQLATEDPVAVELVKLRYFVGMTMEEAAEALGMGKRTAENLWKYAKAKLHKLMFPQDKPAKPPEQGGPS